MIPKEIIIWFMGTALTMSHYNLALSLHGDPERLKLRFQIACLTINLFFWPLILLIVIISFIIGFSITIWRG